MKTAHEKMVRLLKEQMEEQRQPNAKINMLYSNRYGDADPSTIPISGITTEDVTKQTYANKNAQLETTHSIKQLESNVTTLFNSQADITQDLKLMTEASHHTRDDINIMLINRQKIMVCLENYLLLCRTKMPPQLLQLLLNLLNLHLLNILITCLRRRE